MKFTIMPKKYSKYLFGFIYSGTDATRAEVLEVSEGYPMAEAGFLPGDVITAVGETKIGTGGDLVAYFDRTPLNGETLQISYVRNGVESVLPVTPKFVASGYSLGFSCNLAREEATVPQALRYSFSEVKYWIVETARGLARLVTGRLKSDEIGGAVAIVDVIGETYEASVEYGIQETVLNLLYITVLLSANLGVMNLLPIPALDGGKLLFCLIEIVRGKPVDREKEGMVHLVGMILLLILMVLLLFNDIRNLFA